MYQEQHPTEPERRLLEQETLEPTQRVGDVNAAAIQPTAGDSSAQLDADRATERDPPTARPQIWVGSWLDYNNALLHGAWIDAARDADAVWDDIAAMLAASPTAANEHTVAEDWGIFDYEHFGGLDIGENDDITYVAAVARGIATHGPAFGAWADLEVGNEAHLQGFSDAYLGRYESMHAYVEQLIEDAGWRQLLDERLPDNIRPYVDINSVGLALDIEISGDIFVYHDESGAVWLFGNR